MSCFFTFHNITELSTKDNSNNATVELLESTLDYERSEFEQILSKKKKEIEERDKMVSVLSSTFLLLLS